MAKRLITVSSRALGPRLKVSCYVYDTVAEMRAAGEAYNGNDLSEALGVTQARTDDEGRASSVLIRLARSHLGTQIISHEMHHATTALYGSLHGKRMRTRRHLSHYNEGFAHLYSDMLHGLVDRLYALGYYDHG